MLFFEFFSWKAQLVLLEDLDGSAAMGGERDEERKDADLAAMEGEANSTGGSCGMDLSTTSSTLSASKDATEEEGGDRDAERREC